MKTKERKEEEEVEEARILSLGRRPSRTQPTVHERERERDILVGIIEDWKMSQKSLQDVHK